VQVERQAAILCRTLQGITGSEGSFGTLHTDVAEARRDGMNMRKSDRLWLDWRQPRAAFLSIGDQPRKILLK